MGHFASDELRDRFLICYEQAIRLSPEPAETRDIATAFGTVRVYRHGPGDGVPIVLVHPFMTTAASWAANVAALAEHRPVYTLDSLGQGGLSVQTRRIRDSAWFGEVLDELGLRRVHLVGWSYGGWLSFQRALHDPQRVASLTLVDPANTLARITLRWLIRMFSLPVAAAVRPLDSLIDRNTAWMLGAPEPGDLMPLFDAFRMGTRAYRVRAVPYPRYPRDHQLRAVRTPVLALLAGRSAMHDSAGAIRRAQALIPGAETELWPTASHALPVEFADEVNDRILSFVAKH